MKLIDLLEWENDTKNIVHHFTRCGNLIGILESGFLEVNMNDYDNDTAISTSREYDNAKVWGSVSINIDRNAVINKFGKRNVKPIQNRSKDLAEERIYVNIPIKRPYIYSIELIKRSAINDDEYEYFEELYNIINKNVNYKNLVTSDFFNFIEKYVKTGIKEKPSYNYKDPETLKNKNYNKHLDKNFINSKKEQKDREERYQIAQKLKRAVTKRKIVK